MHHASSRPSWMRRIAAMLAVVVAALAIGWWASQHRSRVVYEGEGAFGRIRVVERADGLRALYTGEGRARQSALFPGHPGHLELAYSRVAAIGLALVPADARILYVGLGGGAMPMHARAVLPDARIEVVEIDPAIVEVARRYFGFRTGPRLAVHTGDGREFLERAPAAAYDLIVLDAFSDDEIPRSLTTRQFLEAVRAALAPGGVVVSNLWSANPAYRSMVATYAAVFDQVHLIQVRGRAQRILLAAGPEPRLGREALVEAARSLERRADLGFDLPALVRAGYERLPAPGAPTLEDRPPEGAAPQ